MSLESVRAFFATLSSLLPVAIEDPKFYTAIAFTLRGIIESIKLTPGADSMAYDPQGKMMYVVTGGKNGKIATSYLSKVNPRTGELVTH